MQETLAPEFILSTRLEARDTACQLQTAGYGLQESSDVDGGYEFTYVRSGDGATSTILLMPDTGRERPDFVVMRHNPDLPMCQRGGSDMSFSTPERARDYWATEYDGSQNFEIKPLINVLALH
jgi:hypothetical protein